jgi:hypothetical protein
MSKPQRKPILNASLPAQFRQIRIALAREPGHPDGDDEVAYIFVAPVDAEGRIDSKLWRVHRDACRVARQRPNEEDQLGHLVYRADGAWGFHYDDEANLADEPAIISPTSASSLASMSRSTNAARCTPIA